MPTIFALDGDSVGDEDANGTVIGRLENIGSTLPLTFTLVDNAGGRFRIVGSVLQIADTSLIDAKVDVAHSITVRAVDSDGVSHDQTFVLVVEDQNAPPGNVGITENSVPYLALTGQQVGLLTAVDPEDDEITFTLLDDADGRFAIDPDDPTVLVVADPAKLNFAEAPRHDVIVRATDAAGNFFDQILTLNLDNPLSVIQPNGGEVDVSGLTGGVLSVAPLIDGGELILAVRSLPFGQELVAHVRNAGNVETTVLAGGFLEGDFFERSEMLASARGGYQFNTFFLPFEASNIAPTLLASSEHLFAVYELSDGFGSAERIALRKFDSTGTVVGNEIVLVADNRVIFDITDGASGAGSGTIGLGNFHSRLLWAGVDANGNVSILTSDSEVTEFSTRKIPFALGAPIDPIQFPTPFYTIEQSIVARTFNSAGVLVSQPIELFSQTEITDFDYEESNPQNLNLFTTLSDAAIVSVLRIEELADNRIAVALRRLENSATFPDTQFQDIVLLADPSGHLDTIQVQVTELGPIDFFSEEPPGHPSHNYVDMAAMPDGGLALLLHSGVGDPNKPTIKIINADGSVRVAEFDPAPPAAEFTAQLVKDIVAIDDIGFAVIYEATPGNPNGAPGAPQQPVTLARIYNEDGAFLESKVLPNGVAGLSLSSLDSRNHELGTRTDDGHFQFFETKSGQVVLTATDGQTPADTDNDGDLDLTGVFTIGVTGFPAALLIDGKAEISSDKIVVSNAVVRSNLGPDSGTALFTGGFTIDRATGIATELTGTSPDDGYDFAGLDLVWKGLRLTTDGAAFDVGFALPGTISDGAASAAAFALPNAIPDGTLNGVLTELLGPNALRFTDTGVKLGAGKVTLGTFNVPSFFGLFSAEAKGIVIRYDDTLHQLAIDGELKVKSEIVGGELSQLGVKDTALTFKNLLIKDGKVSIEGALTAKNVEVSPSLALKDLAFNIKVVEDTLVSISAQSTIDFLKSGFPDVVLAGEVLRPPLALNKLTVGLSDIHKPLPHGFFLEKVIGTIDHLAPAPPESPSVPTTLTGTIGFSWGPKVSLTLPQFLGGAAVEGSAVTIDIAATYDMGDIITGSVTGTIIAPEFATIAGQVSYDFVKSTSTLAGTFNYFDGTITGSANVTINEKGQTGLGTAQLNVPNIAMFGPAAGMNLTNVNYFLTVTLDGNSANDLIANWTQLTLPNPITGAPIPVTFGLQVAFDGSVKLIRSASDIPKTNSFDVGGTEDWLMITANWDNAATGHVATRVRTPENTFIQEADYAANGIFIVDDLGSPTKLTIIIDDPRAGNWDLQVIDPVGQGLGTVEYMGLSPDPAPTFTIDELVTVLGDDTVTISSLVDDTDGPPQVYYFFDDNSSGFDGYSIGTLVPSGPAFDFVWDVTGVTRGEYFVYGAAFDGENAPVFDYSDDSVFVAHRPTALMLDGTEVDGNGPHVSISEASAAGTRVGTLGAIDVDAGESFSFALIDSAGGRFVLDGADLKVSPGALLDADLDFGYTVTVRITDQDGLTFDQDIRVGMIDVPGDATVIEGTPSADNLSGGAGTQIFKGSAGNDKINGGAGDDLIVYAGRRSDYRIQEGDTTGGGGGGGYGAPPPPPPDPTAVTITDLRPGGPDGKDLVVKVEVFRFADGNYTREQLFAPDSISLSDNSIAENSGIGAVVGNLTATDPQAGDSLTFSLHSNPDDLFALDGTDLVVAAPLDFESAASHDIVVRVTDAAGHHFDKTFTIAVSNVVGASIRGTSVADLIDDTHTVPGQPLPTAEEDTINGRGGADSMAGGTGNDRYTVDNAGDTVMEASGEGFDTVLAYVDYALQPGSEVERLLARIDTGLTLIGSEFDNRIFGGAGDDTLEGSGGNDVLTGKAGADDMRGGSGNDRYFVDDAADEVTEAAGEGTDTVFAEVDYRLRAGSEVENLRARVDAGLRLSGNELNNNIAGGAGDDTLEGGGGTDVLNGKDGSDAFRFGAPNGFAKIGDFQPGEDILEISAAGFGHGLTAGADPAVVNAVSARAASHSGTDGYFIFDNSGGGLGTLYWDATGGNGADAIAIAKLTQVTALSESDFQLV